MIIITILLVSLGKLATSTMETEGVACMDMADAMPKLQTLTGNLHSYPQSLGSRRALENVSVELTK